MQDQINSLLERIEQIGHSAVRDIQACRNTAVLEELRIRYLGKKGDLSNIMRLLKDVSPEQRKEVGQVANRVKTDVDWALAAHMKSLEASEQSSRIESERIDITLPGRPAPQGRIHPISRIMNEIVDIFTSMGFEVAAGPDMEDEFHNFEAVNVPADHPARDMQDTFYLAGGGLLRTHTSPVQIRTMRKQQPPLAIIAPGKVYRCDADQTHSPMFHQVEGLLVDTQIRFSDLKGVLAEFVRRIMGREVEYRFRPSYFPFTEPSAEMDILWKIPGRDSHWLEVLGSGMVHPKVLEAGGCDPNKVTGFAFGLGVERFAMLKYGIPNINMFYENDLRFLKQF